MTADLQKCKNTRHVCDVRKGYRIYFFAQQLILLREDGTEQPYAYDFYDIKQGELLPRIEDIDNG